MVLPALAEWQETRDALHRIALVLGAARVACCDPLPNDLHFSLDVTAGGLSTATLKCGGELRFTFETLRLDYVDGEGTVFSLAVDGHSQVSLMRCVLDEFDDLGFGLQPSMKHITNDQALELDPGQAQAYWQALQALYTALASFRHKLSGSVTPLVLWPHHFDLAFIWFATEGRDEQSDPQIVYGFAPSSPGLARPYVYAYAWSEATGYLNLPVESPAQAITDAYTGLHAPYDALRESENFNAAIEAMLMKYHKLAAAQLRA